VLLDFSTQFTGIKDKQVGIEEKVAKNGQIAKEIANVKSGLQTQISDLKKEMIDLKRLLTKQQRLVPDVSSAEDQKTKKPVTRGNHAKKSDAAKNENDQMSGTIGQDDHVDSLDSDKQTPTTGVKLVEFDLEKFDFDE